VTKSILKTATAFLLAAAAGVMAQQDFPTGAPGTNGRLVVTPVPNSSYGNTGLGFLSDGRMVFLAFGNTTIAASAWGGGDVVPASPNIAVYLVSGLSRTGDMTGVTFTKILDQLTGPAPGVVVVNDTVYVADRNAFYRINSLNPTGGTSVSQNATRMIDVPSLDSTFSWNRGPTGHQWLFTPQYHNGRFYFAYSGSIRRPAASGAPPTNTLTGGLLSWKRDSVVAPYSATSSPTNNLGYRKEAGGLRSPNGLATNGAYMLHTDNQGSFTPGNPIRLFKPGQPLMTYGHRQCTAENLSGAPASDCNVSQTNNISAANTLRNWAEDLPYMPPLLWVPYSPFRSTSQPAYLNFGPYKGQWIVGDANAFGMGRVVVDNVNDQERYQASFHLFAGATLNETGMGVGNRAAINRITVSPDSAVYIGTAYRIGNWSAGAPGPLLRVTFKDTTIFEVMSIRSRKSADGSGNGIELTFSKPVNPATVTTARFQLQQQNVSLGANYGCNSTMCQTKTPTVNSVSVSDDGLRVFVGIATPDTSIGASHFGTYGTGNNTRGMWGGPGKQDRTLRVTVLPDLKSASGDTVFYRHSWMGWFYQSTSNFTAGTVSITPSQRADMDRLAAAVSLRPLAGALEVGISTPGQATVSVYSLTGELKAEQSGATGAFTFDTRRFDRGLHVLRVKQGAAVISRRINL
jgi:hypothetical protein